MLVIVEDRDVAHLNESALDLEATGCADILEVDTAEGAGKEIDGANDLVYILGADAERKCVNVAELLEEKALAFHNGHTCLGTDVAETENCGTVSDNGNEVRTAGKLEGLVVICLNCKAGLCNTGSVCERKVFAGIYGNTSGNFDLTVPFRVLFKRFFSVIHLSDFLFLNYFSQGNTYWVRPSLSRTADISP